MCRARNRNRCILADGAGIAPIPGTGNPARMEENIKAVPLSYMLTEKDMQVIENFVPWDAMRDAPPYGGNFAKDVFSVEKYISLEGSKIKRINTYTDY